VSETSFNVEEREYLVIEIFDSPFRDELTVKLSTKGLRRVRRDARIETYFANFILPNEWLTESRIRAVLNT